MLKSLVSRPTLARSPRRRIVVADSARARAPPLTKELAMPSNHEIRELRDGDRAAWEPLWRGYQEFYHVDIPADVSNVTWSRLVDPDETMSGALMWAPDGALGLVHFIRHRSCWTVGDYCYLQDLFVSPQARGAGVGRKLIEHVYAEAARHGCSRVYWLTHETNKDAMLLYDRIAERSGFIQYRHLLPSPAAKAKA
jgi:GNAT superfamily N-acetyltransferase